MSVQETNTEVLAQLINAVESQRVVRVYYGDTDTGRDWLEESDTLGRIEKYDGSPTYILVPVYASYGHAVHTKAIVRIQCADTGRDLYRHPKYHTPQFTIHDAVSGYVVKDQHYQPFMWALQKGKCERWMKFITGQNVYK